MIAITRCSWAQSEPNLTYHDTEWGVPSHEDRHLFEMLILEGAQAGLSWTTVLKRREGYREAFHNFNPELVARLSDEDQANILATANIIRNRAKVASAVRNAQAFLKVQEEFGSFNTFLWDFVGGSPVQNDWEDTTNLPASTPLSDSLSKVLLKRGFNFVGSTICYAYMQATGLVNDHVTTCFRYQDLRQ
jgi:DNA-3-methyladenine glycosylase I